MLDLIRQKLGLMPATATADDGEKIIRRDIPTDTPEARKALVTDICKEIRADAKHWEKQFAKMRRNMQLVRDGGDPTWVAEQKYVANIIQRHVKNTVAALYAKNPKAVARPADRMWFRVWDETPESLMMAMEEMASGMPTPQTLELLQDVAEGQSRRKMLERLGRTLEIIFHYYLREQQPTFKVQAKQLVRRTAATGIGYLKLGYQRRLELSPDQEEQMNDITERLAAIERMRADLADGEVFEHDKDAEELRIALTALQAEPEHIAREGLVFTFPRSTAVVPDRACYQLHGFLGCARVSEMHLFRPNRVKELYGIDLGKDFTRYTPAGAEIVTRGDDASYHCMVYEVYDKLAGVVYTVCDGYPDFLKEPAPPPVKLERFWPWFTLAFNEIEDEKNPFPLSDVELMEGMQLEHNRSRQGLREHRQASTPFYVSSAGTLTEEDKDKFRNRVPHEILDLVGLPPGTDSGKIVQQMKLAGIDPNLYETNHLFEDMLRTVGSQEANFGTPAGGSATEASISEGSRLSSVDSNIDDIDMMLTELAREAGQVMLREISQETAMKIAGPGAVWPMFDGQSLVEEVYLEIEAGSSGKPNAQQDAALLERMTPLMVQIPGITPAWIAKRMLRTIDTNIDLSEAYAEGAPSIQALNAMVGKQAGQPSTGDPATDPAQQGAEGGSNAPAAGMPSGESGGALPAFPTGMF